MCIDTCMYTIVIDTVTQLMEYTVKSTSCILESCQIVQIGTVSWSTIEE